MPDKMADVKLLLEHLADDLKYGLITPEETYHQVLLILNRIEED